jgi:hypothetical protein
MWRWLPAVLVMVTGVARAEEPTERLIEQPLEVHAQGAPDLPAPDLPVEPLMRPDLEAFDAIRNRLATRLTLGAHTWATIEGSWWSAERNDPENGGTKDRPGHGWRAALRLSRELGPLHFELTGGIGQADSVGELDNRYTGGMFSDVSASLSMTKKLSRWMTAWIALSFGHRTWLGVPPLGEADTTQGMLTIGTTFR